MAVRPAYLDGLAGRLRLRGDVLVAESLGSPQTQVLQQLYRDVSVPRSLGGYRVPEEPGVPAACYGLGRVQPPPGGRGSRAPTSQRRQRLDGVGDDIC